MLTELESLLERKNQRFVCRNSGGSERGSLEYIAPITHEVEPPLDEEALQALQTDLGDLPEAIAFYQRFGGLRLYCDTVGYASAFYLAPPESWNELDDHFSGWLDILDEDEQAELIPDWLSEYAVIGEVPDSGNYFLLALAGDERGKIFEFEHDGFEFIERGENLAAFIAAICKVDDALIQEIRTHTRYSDGKTSTQWLAEEYHYEP